jgi:hypothetical protein
MHLPGLLLLTHACLASSGDQSSIFQNCVRKCVNSECAEPPKMPLILHLTLWDCPQNCRYDCMHSITDAAILNFDRIHQYNGKWPFYRVWGMQEPASVLFSVLNGLGHFYGLATYKNRIGARFALRDLYVLHGYIAINSWIWSAGTLTNQYSTLETFHSLKRWTTFLRWQRSFWGS